MRVSSRSVPSKSKVCSVFNLPLHRMHTVPPNTLVNLSRYGSRRLAAPGGVNHFPSAASQRLPPRPGYLER